MASFDRAIPPGQEGKITLKVNTKNRKGLFSKTATVYSNDPQRPKTVINIYCIIKPHISIVPSNRVNLVGYEGDKIKKKVTITSLKEQHFEITGITSDIEDKIKYKLKTKKKGREYTLEIRNRSKEEGTFRGRIKLETSSKKKPFININVFVKLQKEVTIRPKSISFGTIDTTKEDFNAVNLTKTFKLIDVRGDGMTIKKIKTNSDWITTETKTRKEGKIFNIIVTLDKDKLPKGHFEEKIKIRTNYKKEYLEVDVKGEVI